MRPKLALLMAYLLGFASPAFGDEFKRLIPDARMVGEGTLSMAFWDVYDARLYAPEGRMVGELPYALSIHYMREIRGSDIADRSVEEIRKQGFTNETKLAEWNRQLKQIFPDVKNGTVLSAVFLPDKETIFYDGDNRIGIVKDAEFTRWFSDIWLGERTSEPQLRRKLLGLS